MTDPTPIDCGRAGQKPRPPRLTEGDVQATIYGVEGIFTALEAIDDGTDEARVSLIAAGLELCRRAGERL
jgi:hypothetical protein